MIKDYFERVEDAAKYIKSKMKVEPKVGIILGSGLGSLADEVQNPVIINYEDIPNFPVSTVQGHVGRIVTGLLEDNPVLILQGRFHYYEGYQMRDVTFAVRVMKLLGIDNLIVTNASGGVNTSFKPGDLMLITDHINFAGVNPLVGRNIDEFGLRFPDMTYAYSKKLLDIARESAKKIGIAVKEGVYLYFTGPSYETPAEIKMTRILGADAVGMSTVPEVIVARHSDINVLGISCIANLAAGMLDVPLNHQEVLTAMEGAKNNFVGLIREVLKNI